MAKGFGSRGMGGMGGGMNMNMIKQAQDVYKRQGQGLPRQVDMGRPGQQLLPQVPVLPRRQALQGRPRQERGPAIPGEGKLSIHKALPEPVPPKKAVEGGLRRNRGHRRNVPLPENAVRAGQQLPGQSPAPGLRMGGHRVQIGGPVSPPLRHHKGRVEPGGHGPVSYTHLQVPSSSPLSAAAAAFRLVRSQDSRLPPPPQALFRPEGFYRR